MSGSVSSGGAPTPPSVLELLRDRRWAPVAGGSAIALVGFWIYSILGAVVVYQLTGRTLLVGVLTALQFGANLLVAPFAGLVLDRVGLRRGMVLSTASSAVAGLVLSGAVLTDRLSLPLLFVAATVTGVASALTAPGLQSMMPRVLALHEVPTAIVVHSGAMTVARAVGPAVAGVWLALDGYAAGFACHGLAYACFGLGVLVTPVREAEVDGPRGLRRAWTYVLQRPMLSSLLGATLLVAWGTDPVNTLLPALANRLGGGESLVGVLASSFGAGALAATLGFPRASARLSYPRLGGSGLTLLGLGLLVAAVAPGAAVAIVAFMFGGIGFVGALTAVTSQLQANVEPRFRSHVMGLWSAAFLGGRLPASLVNGAVADAVGVRGATAGVGLMLVASGLLGVRLLRER